MFLSYIFLNSSNWIFWIWCDPFFVVQIFPSLNDNPILWHEQSKVRGLTLSFSFLSTFLCVQKFYRRDSLKKHYHVLLYTRNICIYMNSQYAGLNSTENTYIYKPLMDGRRAALRKTSWRKTTAAVAAVALVVLYNIATDACFCLRILCYVL